MEKQDSKTTLFNLMGLNAMQQLMRVGTPEQIQEFHKGLEEAGYKWDDVYKKPIPLDYKPNLSEKELEYAKQLWGKHPENEMGDIAKFVKFKLNRKPRQRPDAVDYHNTRKYLWQAFRQIVWEETKIKVSGENLEKDTKLLLKNLTHWIVGSSGGDLDPGKSLYIHGGLGVGKSTIALATHMVLSFFKSRTGWTERYMSYQSLEALFLETLATEQLKIISRFQTGGWILDELKPEMYLVQNYGNQVQLANRILHARHEIWKSTGWNTIITSNTSWSTFTNPDHLNDKRLTDRIKQQYIPIELKGSNKRKPAFRLKNQSK